MLCIVEPFTPLLHLIGQLLIIVIEEKEEMERRPNEIKVVDNQGYFPRLENLAAFRPVSTDPARATCGFPERSVFCQSDVDINSVQTCAQRLCVQECPYRSKPPGHRQLLLSDVGRCVKKDKSDLHPGSPNNSTSFIFYHKDCFVTPPVLKVGSSFTLTVWLKPEEEGVMCVIEKSADGQIVFKLTISEKGTVFYYRTVNGLQPPIKVMTQGRFLVKKWIHLSVQVHQTRISFFVDGLEDNGTAFDSRTLSDPISDTVVNTSVVLGQNANGLEQFVGRMQDFRLYEMALTNREIIEVFSKDFPYLHIQSECRCPGSHPRVHPLKERFCVPNGVNETTKDIILRLNPDSHPLSYINDKDLETTWISPLLSSSDFHNGNTITLDLLNGQYQVFYVIIQFYSLMPQALKIQRKKDRNSPWVDWQYFANDCQYFGMENNGILKYPDSVNCQQLPRDTPYSRGNITFSILKPEPANRPGYNDFYRTDSLQEFVKASSLRIHMFGQYHREWTGSFNISHRHRYYGINEITVSGRCNCHGHARSCDTSVSPYRCLCEVQSYTAGNNCDHCLPLFNNKSFRQGDQVNAYNCSPCQCHNHSSSCHYNVTLDRYPDDHDRGGGGVCDHCLHNTTGRHCEWCKNFFFRQVDANLSAADVCKPCDCNMPGTVNGNLQCEKIGGQCYCKTHVSGRKCDQCKDGFYDLRQGDPYGCQPCNCNISGTVNESIICDKTTGQCKCKPNVTGLRCDGCILGFKQQNPRGEEPCEPCNCSVNGSINQFCNPITGQCKCREDVKGPACDTCIDNYYGLDTDGCKHCDCYKQGIIPGTVCDPVTGRCVCQPNIGGRQCNECLSGYYKVQRNNCIACVACKCDTSGTINRSETCDSSTGQCLCKAFVTGKRCNTCMNHMYNLSDDDHLGCRRCDCDPFGTLVNTTCDRADGQCKCLPNYQGRRCDECKPGFYLSEVHGMRCVPCLCHPSGSLNEICNSTNGQCACQDSSITGQKCDRCHELFFGFDLNSGRCRPCTCNAAGAVNNSCDVVTGHCFCKQFVRGFTCDRCVEDASHLDALNLYGCSTTPKQQPPPQGYILNSTTIILSWNPPDSPNSNQLNYVLYRDKIVIYKTTDRYPYGLQNYTDTSLSPYTEYTYYIDAYNVHGLVTSTKVVYRTRSGAPTGEMRLSHSNPADPYSASFNWSMSLGQSGPIERYRLMYTTVDSLEPNICYEGLNTSMTMTNLLPFTRYNFTVQACTAEGCLQSSPVTLVTPQAPPAHQDPPVLRNSSSTKLQLQWSPPSHPNGIIIRYEVYMRGVEQIHGNRIPAARRVFHTTGWLNPQPIVESENENALKPPSTSTQVTNLEPNTEYEFCVVAANMAGSVTSEWVAMKTKESAPVFMPAPTIFPLSAHSLNVSWERPTNNAARGKVTGFTINAVTEEAADGPRSAPASEVLYVAEANELFYEVTGLEPYHGYTFTITFCNTVGCVTSAPGAGQTLASAPENVNAPVAHGINSTVMKITWPAPSPLNGPSPVYQLERVDPSLTMSSKTDFVKGTRFPGNGYLKFPPSTLPMNTYFTGIKIQFRTKEPDGLILCAVSAGTQEEYIALQIRNGRPYFLFDPQGSAVSVSPTNDGEKQYNDNKWHQIIARRYQSTGNITVDGQYTGSSVAISGSTIIGENTGVFIGGFPEYFAIERYDTVWEPLQWNGAVESNNIYEKWEGCPDSAEEGAHFLGFGFLELDPSIFPDGPDFAISFMFKTDQLKGLLVFACNGNGTEYFIAQLNNGMLNVKIKNKSSQGELNLWAGLSYCNGRWNTIHMQKEGTIFSVQLNDLVERVDITDSLCPTTTLRSALYIGGVPERVQHLFPDLALRHGFGGCMKHLTFTQGVVVIFASVSRSAVRVNLDGCLSTASAVNCRGNDSIVVYRGKEQTVYESDLQPFTEYLYRVYASNDGGTGASAWSRGRTKAAVPQNVQTPLRLLDVNGYSAEVTWARPSGVRGVIEQYFLNAYTENSPNIFTSGAVFSDSSQVNGTLRGLQPSTMYIVTLSVCTQAGCSENSHVLRVSTLEEVPEDVQTPVAESFPDSLHLHWPSPRKPNGIITRYILYMDGSQIYKGIEREHNVTALGTFTAHHFVLSACTLAGCANSTQVTLYTAQSPPDRVDAPNVTILDPTSIFVQWNEPEAVNGVLERYMIHISKDNSSWDVAYNSTELFLDYTIRRLSPGSTHFIRISACTAGGCTTSKISTITTDESIPEGVKPPLIQSHSPYSFNISWTEPIFPNGIITGYGLYMNGILMQNSSQLSCFVDGLSPWSKHSFRLQACTAKGCAQGEEVEAHTEESQPEGNIRVHSITDGPRGIQIKWQGPEKPNGNITYSVIVDGLFYVPPTGNEICGVVNSTKVLHRSQDSNKWVFIAGLVPFSDYSIRINASNSQGYLISDTILITLPPGAPDGVLPPRVSAGTPTSLQVVWSTPVRNNAPGFPRYRLQMRATDATDEITDLYTGPTASFTYTVKDLQPFTAYHLRIGAFNKYGGTNSNWTVMFTEEDRPGHINPPSFSSVKARSLTITWQHPLQPNGIITHYNIYQNGSLRAAVPGNSSSYNLLNLSPYTLYQYQLEGCTSAGCTLSSESLIVQTQPDAPSDIPPPDLYSDTPTSVVIKWRPPVHPNGIVDNYTIERRIKGTERIYKLFTLLKTHAMEYVDQTSDLSPWKTYEYRITVATVNGGANSSSWSEVKTRPSRPAAVEPPDVSVLGPYSAMVTWKMPLMPNGEIIKYEIRMPEPRITIANTTLLRHTVTNLIPYTNYSVSVMACSGGDIYHGGCTESPPTQVTTYPAPPEGINPLTATPISETFITVSWQPPSRPNGPNIRYELLRRKILQPLASNPPEDLNLWLNIYSGTRWFYEDKGLSRYTSYEYRLIVHNAVGYTSGPEVTVTTMAGPPKKGCSIKALPVNHTAIEVAWSKPSLQDLQGDVEHYTLLLNSSGFEKTLTFAADVNSATIGGLYPSTEYLLRLQVSNGAYTTGSDFAQVTTLDGEPEGMFPPEVDIISRTAARVIWTSPSNPNGAVTEYSIHVNNKVYRTGMSSPGAYILEDLLPYTVYNIQVEVCTVYACTKSNATQVTTAENEPSNIPSPIIKSVNSRSVEISWASPGQPNGILLGFDVRRKTFYTCSFGITSCVYHRCKKNEDICGDTCYSPETQACCSGVLHDRRSGYRCCGDHYVASGLDPVDCCSGNLYPVQPSYQCCGTYYIKVQPGEVCCYNALENRVSVGDGDSCCGGTPFSTSGNQICCGGSLYDKSHQQCCGGEIAGLDFVCCGNDEEGTLHRPSPGLSCCGNEYVNLSESFCCSDSNGQFKIHLKEHEHMSFKCCESELISETEECCNGAGYNPFIHACANKVPENFYTKQEKCGLSRLCPISLADSAYCGQCSFNVATDSCFVRNRTVQVTGTSHEVEDFCPTEEEIVYTGGPDTYNFTDTGLDPFTTYEYRVSTWNSAGHGFSNASRVTTKQGRPQGVHPPRWSKVDKREDAILLRWKEPAKPNGVVHYVILRDGIEHFKGISLQFLDKRGIQPYREYTYQLRACTVAGCLDSAKVYAAIKQGVPEDVAPPTITAVNSTALLLSWPMPKKPNGNVKEYKINQIGKGVIYVTKEGKNQYTVTDLQPYRRYYFSLTVCTSIGCSTSEPFSGQTLQDAPQGVWSNPRHVIINTTALELYWNEPEMPNGIVAQYILIRNGEVISRRSGECLNFTDVGLLPDSRYSYQLEASTEGGRGISELYVTETPAETPQDIPLPYNITVLGPHTIYVAWDSPGVFSTSIPLAFNVLLNAGRMESEVYSAGEENFIVLKNLKPHTQYDIRIQACQNGGCGAGYSVSALTEEAAPEELDPPVVSADDAKSIKVTWKPPKKPNGIITKYYIHRRLADQHEIALVFVWSEGLLEFNDSSDGLFPYAAYEYCIAAQNSKGSVKSPWTLIRAQEAVPEDMEPPSAQVRGAYSVSISWTPPRYPNGVIRHYHILYQETGSDESISASSTNSLTVPGSSHHTKVFGLNPFSTYKICVEALNNAGKISSPWIFVQTLEAPPSGVNNLTVEKRENGRALLIQWSEPRKPNGVVKTYNIYSDGNLEYSGLSHRFLFRRLEPHTVYTLILEACTAAGCTQTFPQPVQTEEAPPASQHPPAIESCNSTHIKLNWSPPIHRNGVINHYDVIKRCRQGNCSPLRKNMYDGEVIHTEFNTSGNIFRYIDDELRPWTSYEYKIRAWNSAGSTNSSWILAQTSQAAPSKLLPPKLYHVENSPDKLYIQWTRPVEANGIILSYRLQRNSTALPFSFDSLTFNYTDRNLMAYSDYSYSVIACTLGGCSTSLPAHIKTLEAPPELVTSPNVDLLNATTINVTWSSPLIQNGEITKYIVQMDDENHFAGKGLYKVVSNLEPFTLFDINLLACTNGGCASSSPVTFKTMEAPPTGMRDPTFTVTGADSVQIMWQIPDKPNGEIRSYELRRDDLVIYVGSDTHYYDLGLQPGTEYTYSVQASNNQGSTSRSSARIRTDPSSPSGMEGPQMEAKGPHEILVTWRPPSRTNGDIVNYTVTIRSPFKMEEKQYQFNNSFTVRRTYSFTVKDLMPYHQYDAKVEACTLLGCAASGWVTGSTLEAPPESQPPPFIDLQTDHQVPLIIWNSPQQPNGQIIYYELYRRPDLKDISSSKLVYNGSSTSFKDVNVLPFTKYEYQVWAVNSAGKTPSPWVYCQTGPAAPEGVPAPVFESVSSTTAVADITTPSKPNGIITLYRLLSTGNEGADTVLSEGTSGQQTVYGLKPFTNYSVLVEVCTCLKCCSRGPVVQITTQPAQPSHLLPPRATSTASRAASFHWHEPQSPNGIIQSYEVHTQITCPQPAQVGDIPCTPGQIEVTCRGREKLCDVSNLQPYTRYRVRVVANNSAGSTASEWTSYTTLKEKPEYKSNFIVSSNITTLFLDWSLTFQLNGRLKEFAVTERGQRVYSGLDSRLYIPKTTDKTFYFQVTCTTDMGTASTPIVRYNSATGLAPALTFPSGKNGTAETGNAIYNELWFIILMALLGLLLLAIVLSLALQRKLSKQPYPRDRPPLVPLQQRASPSSAYSQNETYMNTSLSDNQHALLQGPLTQVPITLSSQVSETNGKCDPVAVLSGSSNQVTLKRFTMHSEGISEIKIPGLESTVIRKTSHSQISHSFSQNSLYRSASQLMTSHDKKSLVDSSVWDSVLQGHDSGMYMDDEDLVSTIKSFSTVTKQHTAFTDTPL
ncbi:usherin [Spea bombifrons]|uniref:usherin n=1 Tax=Spea bombifrons TaxID=233779 RepID=UPI00234B7A04|nr:usherin [Spea bombifrons]